MGSAKKVKEFVFDADKILERLNDRVDHMNSVMCKTSIKKISTQAFNPLMATILCFLDASERDANERFPDGRFYGLTGSNIEKIFVELKFEAKEIKETLYKLARYGFLVYRKIQGDPTYYYKINKNRFVCNCGMYCIYCSNVSSNYNLFLGYCELYHFCDCKAQSCDLPYILREKAAIMSGIDYNNDRIKNSLTLKYISDKIYEKRKDEDKISQYTSEIREIIGNQVENLTKDEIIEYHYELDEINKREDAKEGVNLKKILRKKIIDFISLGKTIPIEEGGFQLHPREYTANYKNLSKRYNTGNIEKIFTSDIMGWINPLMSSILSVLSFGRRYAELNNWTFPGLSMYQIERLTGGFWINNENVFENVYYLVRNNFVNKFRYEERYNVKKSNPLCKFHYDLNETKFPCYSGYYSYYGSHPSLSYRLCNGVCEHHPFCNQQPSSCKLVDILTEKTKILLYPYKFGDSIDSDFFNKLRENFNVWITDEKKFELYADTFIKFLDQNRDKFFDIEKLKGMLFNTEIGFYGKMLYNRNPSNVNKINEKVISSLVDLLNVNDIKDRKKRRKKKKVDVKKKDDIRAEILRQIMEEPLSHKISIDDYL